MLYELQNEYIAIKVDSFGAELKSLRLNATNREYLWQADPAYWKRTSPILFPIVGRLWDHQYRYKGNRYAMPQHGFARDKEFTLFYQDNKQSIFLLEDDEETRGNYPFRFRLFIQYTIEGCKVSVRWRVINLSNKTMHFSIGSHPAFICPFTEEEEEEDCRLQFDANAGNTLLYKQLNDDYLCKNKADIITLNNNQWSFQKHVFNKDVYIFENYQIQEVSILRKDDTPYLSIKFQAPVVGIWSPPKKQAPFICIEPWFGRCDSEVFIGDLEEREYGNSLWGGAEFSTEYTIEIFK